MTAPVPNPLMVRTPGMAPLPIPPELLQPLNPQALAIQTQGQTPDAQAVDRAELQRLQLEDIEQRKKLLKGVYGSAFPPVGQLDGRPPTESDWQKWCDERWTMHRPGVQHNIWTAERNRQFRSGYQWQSRINSMGAWRETPTPRDSVKIVDNRIRPALAWAMQVVAEQRPGWQFKPTNNDADRQKKADAQQRATEYQYDAQLKRLVDRETLYWAQTDGVAFQMTFWNPDKGPWEELEQGKGPVPLGEPDTRVFRVEQVVVSAEATSTISPTYWIVRDILPMQYAVSLYGPDVADDPDQALLAQQSSQWSTTNQYAYAPLYQNQQTVARYFVFCDKRDWLPEGLTAVIVGRKLVYGPVPLLMGRVPMVRVTDGSEDPAFFPVPKMNLLLGPQMRVNMLWSKWYENIRKNAGGRYATKSGAVSAETLVGGETSMLEVRTSGPIQESILPIQGFMVGPDIKDALQIEIATLEELTGYTKEARGQFESDQSGRAILAQRETLERVFAPQVAALAEANTEWAKQTVGWMRFGYQMPRMIAITGKNRADLAMEITAADMDGIVDVTVDPSTMIPKPQALRQWENDNAYDRKIIDAQEWRERSLFGNDQDFETPNDVQYGKAQRVAEQIRLGQPQEPMVWQDDESIHQNVLERELILAGGTDPQISQVAQQRWQQLAQQAQQKHGPPPIDPNSPAGAYQKFIQTVQQDVITTTEQLLAKTVEQMIMTGMAPGMSQQPGQLHVPGVTPIHQAPSKAPPKGQPMNPKIAPLLASNPSVAAGPSVAAQGGPGVSQQEQAVGQFEARQSL